FFALLIRLPPTSTLFPYTTLFRSAMSDDQLEVPLPSTRRGFLLGTGGAVLSGAAVALLAGLPGRAYAGAKSGAKAGVADLQILKDRKSTRLNSSHVKISYAVFCLK